MATLASLRILLGLDSGDVSKGATRVRGELKGVQAEANKTRDAFTGIKQGIAAGFGLGGGIAAFNVAAQGARELTEFIGDSITRASALNETLSKSSVIFGQDAAAVEAWGRTAATAFGQSTGQAIEARATLGNLFKTMGLGQADVLGMSQNVVELASDLASFNNIGVDEALEKLRSGLVGQAEPLRTLGVQLTEANVEAKALALGLADANGALSESAKVQARYALILEQTGTAQGDFEKTSGGLANQQKTLTANIADLSAEFGALVVGPLTSLVEVLNDDVIPGLRTTAELIGGVGQAAASAAGPVAEFIDSLTPDAGFDWRDLLHPDNRPSSIDQLALDFANAAGLVKSFTYDTKGYIEVEQAAARATAIMAMATREAGEGLGTGARAAKDMGDGSREAGEGVAVLTAGVGDLVAQMALIERNVLINIAYKIDTAPFINPNAPFGTADANRNFAFDSGGDQGALDQATANFLERDRIAKAAAAEAQRAANEAAAEAKRRAAEAKRLAEEAARQAERDAADARRAKEEEWRAAQEVADRYFDRVHKGNLDAIDDIRDRRNAELDAANAAIQGPVDAERQRLEAIRDAERESGLRGAVAAAETPADLVAAQRDLQRFLEDERVEFMQGQADAGKALNEAARENAAAAADMAVAAEALRDIAARERFDPRVTRSADGSVARLDVADFLSDAPITVNVYIDGERVTEVVDRRLNTRRTNISPTSVSTGSAR